MICRVESSPSTSSTLTGMFGKTISSSSTSPAPATTASASSSPVLPLSSFAPISTSNPNHATAICCFSPLGSLLAGGVSDTAAIRASAAAKYPARKISSVSSRWRAGHVNVYRTCSHPWSAGPAVTCLELGHQFRYFRCPASDSSRDWLSSTRHVAGLRLLFGRCSRERAGRRSVSVTCGHDWSFCGGARPGRWDRNRITRRA
ncbi:hypothetical protein GW17_00034928 [Ensete ventricosum]|nr:hypothetical protein GW17_00034928 [Ensete ventricosum]